MVLPIALVADTIDYVWHLIAPGLPMMAMHIYTGLTVFAAIVVLWLFQAGGASGPGACVRAIEPDDPTSSESSALALTTMSYDRQSNIECLNVGQPYIILEWHVRVELDLVSATLAIIRGFLLVVIGIQAACTRCCLMMLMTPVLGAGVVLMIVGGLMISSEVD